MLKKAITVVYLLLFSYLNIVAQTNYNLDWLTIDESLKETWSITTGTEEFEGKVFRSNESENVQYKILILCSKKSSSYILAFNKLLEVVGGRFPNTEFIFYNFNKNEDRASEIVTYEADNDITMIVAMGSEAMIFSAENLSSSDIPVVTCINKDPVLLGYVDDYKNGSGTNIAYTSVNVPLNVNIEWLLKFKPNLKSMTILYDPDHSSVVKSEVLPLMEYLKDSGVFFYDGAIKSGESIEEDIAITMKKGIDFMEENDPGLDNSLFWLTSSTNIFSKMEVIAKQAGNVPVASSVPNTVNSTEDSAMLAFGIDRRNSANLAALYILEILTGNSSPGELPVGVVTPPDISISFFAASKVGERIPFEIFENASFVYGYDGRKLREYNVTVENREE